jgi:hypothetical protein
MSEQPVGEGLGGAFGQHLDGTAALHVDQDRAVVVPALESEIVNTKSTHGLRLGIGQGTDETQQGVLADTDGLYLGQSGAGPAAQSERDRLADPAQQEGAAAVAEGQPVDLLGEGPLAAVGAAAEEPANPQVKQSLLARDRRIGDLALVMAVHACGLCATAGTYRRYLSPSCVYSDRASSHPDSLDTQADEVREQNLDQFSVGHPA